jgi:hypothetical protein
MFPLQTERPPVKPGPLQIPWSIAEKAYGAYAAQYGRQQTLERLAQRGGFGWSEMDMLYPPWRDEVDELAKLRARVAELAKLRARVAELERERDEWMRAANEALATTREIEVTRNRAIALVENLRAALAAQTKAGAT